MGVVIRKATIAELEEAPHIYELLDEYASESSIAGLPHPFAKVDMYRKLEANGAIEVIGAFLDGWLVGFIIVLAPILPHYSVRIAVVESFFVMKECRKTGAGLKLLKAAEDYTKDQKACGLLVSAPLGGSLAEVLPNVGYTETNRVFFRSISDE